jgi:hypothetical protein
MKVIAACGMFVAIAMCCPASEPESAPVRFAECEGADLGAWLCGGVWTFTGNSGKAQWPNGGTANLVIEHFDPEQVVIRRTDTGISLGATAIYTGVRKGYRVQGKVIYTWPDKWPEPKTGTFSATMDTVSGATAIPGARPGSSFPDIGGVWQLKAQGAGQNSAISVVFVQNGADVSAVLLAGSQPRTLSYQGRFESNTLISGRTCNSSADQDNPYCTLEASPTTVIDASHLRDNDGDQFEKIAGRDDPRYKLALTLLPSKNAKPYLPVGPFDFTGTWQASTQPGILGRMQIKQANGMVNITSASGGYPFFTGWYLRNPVIGGTRLSRDSTHNDVRWSAQTLFIDSPDAIRVTSEGDMYEIFRISPPAIHDLPCDLANPAHVDPYYAWMRGRVALQAKDESTARCWLTLSSNLDWPAGQSLLAAMLVNATPPDYDAAFQLATRSAAKSDIMGEFELASLYRDGKGAALDAAKAQYWQTKAEHDQEAAKWREFNARNAPLNAMARVLMVWFISHVGDDTETEEDREASARNAAYNRQLRWQNEHRERRRYPR